MSFIKTQHLLYLLIATIVVGITVHAPLSVIGTKLSPDNEDVLKAWKEIILAFIVVVLSIELYRKKMIASFMHNIWVMLPVSYISLHIITLLAIENSMYSEIAGLLIDVRYIGFFVAMYVFIKLYPRYSHRIIKMFIMGAVLVSTVAVLQTLLPKDILSYIGYDKTTILPYLLVDQNPDLVRVNSTLRGPNPLGAYSVISLGILVAAVLHKAAVFKKNAKFKTGILITITSIALFVSYSRSALIGAIIMLGCLLAMVKHKEIASFMQKKYTPLILICATAIVAFILSLAPKSLVLGILFHDNPANGIGTVTNTHHMESLIVGIQKVFHDPLGYGIGSTGSASLRGSEPFLIENQYLYIAHEVGIVGLCVFLALYAAVLVGLWKRRAHWLAAGVFASGVGLVIVGLVLPVWVDDTVSIVWWGLAGLILASSQVSTRSQNQKKS